MSEVRLNLSQEQAESVLRAAHNAVAVSLAARGLKTMDGMAIDEAFDAIHELAWDISTALRELLHAHDPKGFPAP